MKIPVLLTCIVAFSSLMIFQIHRDKERSAQIETDFWEREREANSTRRKSLDNLDYITIPTETLPLNLHLEDDTIKQYADTIVELSKSPIVNLTGISNTDLKLKYGAPNIDLLSVYDQRYTTLASTLQKWALALNEYGETAAVKTILEYAISTRTDVSGTYRLLASIYSEEDNVDGLRMLISVAESLNSPMKKSILDNLNSLLIQHS